MSQFIKKIYRSLSGVMDMVGYRMTLNLSYNLVNGGQNSSQSCRLQDDVATSTILVRCYIIA